MTSTSIITIFLPGSMGTFFYKHRGWDALPSYAWRSIEDGANSRGSQYFQHIGIHYACVCAFIDNKLMDGYVLDCDWYLECD